MTEKYLNSTWPRSGVGTLCKGLSLLSSVLHIRFGAPGSSREGAPQSVWVAEGKERCALPPGDGSLSRTLGCPNDSAAPHTRAVAAVAAAGAPSEAA